MSPTLYYCYDAWCEWCYSFSPVIRRVFEEYRHQMAFEVLSGGMILPGTPRQIGVMAEYMLQTARKVEEHTGIRFGEDWLWHVKNPDDSDWYPSSEKPAIALCVLKDYYPDAAIAFAGELQYALHYEGRDLTDDEAYRHILEKYSIPDTEFYQRLHDQVYKSKAYDEFALVQQLGVTGFPAVFLQVSEGRLHLISRGYTDHATLRAGIVKVLDIAGNP